MDIYRDLASFPHLKNAVVTIGTFDGVHIGHRKILGHVVDTARHQNSKSVVVTFWPHPRLVLFPKDAEKLKLLFTLEEKIEAIRATGIDCLLIIPFDIPFSQWPAEDFLRIVLKGTIGTGTLIIGYDHHFGHNREGNLHYLKTRSDMYGFEVKEIPSQDIDDIAVSSTKIRNALAEGNVALATQFIGKPYTLMATVVSGQKKGRTIGYPTANLCPTDGKKLIPADGVYAVRVVVDNVQYGAMINIGYRPTVDGKQHSIEVHIFDFDADIYGNTLQVMFVSRLRDEKKFDNLDALKSQLDLDKTKTKEILKTLNI